MCETETDSAEHKPSRRLRISHLLLITTVCAFVLAIRTAWTDWEVIPVEIRGYARSSLAYGAILYGIALSALLLFGWSRVRGAQSIVSHPGHWLLLFLAFCVVLDGLCSLVVWAYKAQSTSAHVEFYAWNIEKLSLCTIVGVNCLAFSWLMQSSRWWKTAVVVPGCVLLLLVPQHILAIGLDIWRPWFATSHAYAEIVVTVLILFCISVAALRDRAKQADYDWLHWAGVSVTVAFAIGGLIESIYWLNYSRLAL